jgi:hypothetical protein
MFIKAGAIRENQDLLTIINLRIVAEQNFKMKIYHDSDITK